MATTVQTIHDLLPISGSRVGTDATLKACKLAAYRSAPSILVPTYRTVSSMAANTYAYELSSTDFNDIMPAYGLSAVYLHPANANSGPPMKRRDWEQYRNTSSNWVLRFGYDVVANNVGQQIDAYYASRTTAPTTTTESLELPEDYLISFCVWWYALNGLHEIAAERGAIRDRLLIMKEEWQQILRANQTRGLSQTNRPLKDKRLVQSWPDKYPEFGR